MGTHRKSIAGFESAHMTSRASLTIIGTEGFDQLEGSACRLVMRGERASTT